MNGQHGGPTASQRLPQLDGIRGLAILMVVFWHYVTVGAFSAPSPSALHYVRRTTSLAWSGVDLFFVLSGFLITGILLDHLDSRNLFKVFYLRRCSRILPVYLLTLLSCALAWLAVGGDSRFAWLFNHLLPPWAYLSFLQNFVMAARGNFGGHYLATTWSLSVEEQFYLVWPALVVLCRNRRRLLVLSLALMVLAPALRVVRPGFWTFVSTPCRLDSLATGAIAAIILREPGLRSALLRHLDRLRRLFFWLLAATVWMTHSPGVLGGLDHLVLSLLYGVFLLWCVLDPGAFMARIMSTRVLRWLGRISYALYMWHEPVNGLMHSALREARPQFMDGEGVVVTLAALIIVLGLATVSERTVERRFLAWGRRTEYQDRAQVSAEITSLR